MTERCPVVHFEMPYRDAERAARFYETVFGWDIQPLGPETGGYVFVETTESREGRPTAAGQINGGMFPYKPDWPAQTPLAVIAVPDITSAMARVTQAGGKVHGEPMYISGVGQYVAFQDSEGNAAAMLEPDRAGAE